MLRSLALAALAMLASGAAAVPPTPPLTETLLAAMAKTPPVATPFVQVSYRALLDRPLVVSGSMRWLGGDRLERDVLKPFKETAKIAAGELSVQRGGGAVHRISLARAPQAGAMLAGFRALLGGDLTALQQDFLVSAARDDRRWVVTLTPRSDALKRRLVSIMIVGAGSEPRCLTVNETDGDSSITLVGAMARGGLQDDAPREQDLAARCRSGR